jgi:hypothetical protein
MASTEEKNSPKTPDPVADQDPYFDWALGAGRSNFFLPGRQAKWMPVLVKLAGATPRDFADGSFFDKDTESDLLDLWIASVNVPEIYTEGPAGDEKDAYCMAMVTEKFRELLNIDKVGIKVAMVELGLPLDAEQLPQDWLKK